MQGNPLDRFMVGALLILAGLLIVIFHKSIKEHRDSWNERVPWFIQWSPPGGVFFTISLIVFGAVLIILGAVELSGAFIQQ